MLVAPQDKVEACKFLPLHGSVPLVIPFRQWPVMHQRNLNVGITQRSGGKSHLSGTEVKALQVHISEVSGFCASAGKEVITR